MEQVDKDWDEILATHRTVCEEQQEEQKLCAVCNRCPVIPNARIPIVSIVRNAARMAAPTEQPTDAIMEVVVLHRVI